VSLRRIEEIEIGPSGHLLVRPEPLGGEVDAMIYRAGSGLRWDPKERAFHAWEPHRWPHAELLQHIVRVLSAECGTTLRVSETTRWINIPQEQVAALRSVVASEGAPDA
jgi:hypothetical protein